MSSSAKITLHWLNGSRASRVLWLLEELGVQYETKTYYRQLQGRAPPELKKISPLGKSPIVEVEWPDRREVLSESGHITNYLIKYFDTKKVVTPTSSRMEDQNDYFTQFSEGSFMTPIVLFIILGAVENSVPALIRAVPRLLTGAIKSAYCVPETLSVLKMLDDHLSKAQADAGGDIFLAGDHFTGGDILITWIVVDMIMREPAWKPYFKAEDYPVLMKWVEQMKSRPAYKKSQEIDAELAAAEPK